MMIADDGVGCAVEANGATVAIRSAVGRGTRSDVRLPLHIESAAPVASDRFAAPRIEPEAQSQPSARHVKRIPRSQRQSRTSNTVLPESAAVVREAWIGRLAFAVSILLTSAAVGAQNVAPIADAAQANPPAAAGSVTCLSNPGERVHCPADTSAGVLLQHSTGSVECLLGNTWGYDSTGVWVSNGCGGVFALRQDPNTDGTAQTPQAPRKPAERIESWGEFEPGQGFLVGRSSAGELGISAYALVRYVNQLPAEQTFVDHLGNERTVDNRNDFYPHRVLVFFKGWLGNEKLIYNIILWTVNTTDQKNIFGSVGYQFTRRFSLYAGINGLPGTRSLQGSHPLWLGHDRVMADEYFRPYFSNGIWAQGEIVPGLWYNAMLANNLSALGIKATELDRKWASGASMWWTPTTHEFGPKGAFGDWEMHEKVATRFGFSSTFSPEQRYTDATTGAPGNTTIRLADSLNVFDTGTLAPNVTVQNVHYRLLSIDAGMKYRGIFLQAEIYNRWLNDFTADGPLPITTIHESGFYVQSAFFPIPKKLELYGATSQIFGDKSAGFENSHEYIGGINFYPLDTRHHRLNVQVINVDHSPASSTFGYYTGGQHGTTVSVAFSVFF